jgi:CheY-like chemotaxis protein/signal transduction histidine kinase/CHASE3 domain sensor protein
MTSEKTPAASLRRTGIDSLVALGLLAAIVFFLLSGGRAYQNIETLREDSARVAHSHEAIVALDDLLSTIKDAETGQRGFLLTGDPRYLEPYSAARAAIDAKIGDVADLTRDNASQQGRIAALRRQIDAKIAELQETIDLKRTQGQEAALAVVTSDRGKAAMDAIRVQIAAMDAEESALRVQRMAEMADAYRSALVSSVFSTALGVVITLIVGGLIRRAALARQREEWLQAGEVGLAGAMLGDPPARELAERILRFLAPYLGAPAGAIYLGADGGFARNATYGVPADAAVPEHIAPGDGLLAQAAAEGRALRLADVPEGYLSFGSALGRAQPRHLVLLPAAVDGQTQALIELGFIREVEPQALTLLDRVREPIAVAVRSAHYRAELQNLLEETQRQSEELQVQGEELRVSNEELEEQSRALKESQARLEQQQVELEQTNSQLEAQAGQLEAQRDDLARVNAAVQLKARELEQASRYKSDFLANMSHELRTPLNSSLILAKLLADNRDGNLTDEQIKYARTIQSSGNDLLNLINDILDLSKIEAGHVEMRPETLALSTLAGNLRRTFDPIAASKGLGFEIALAPDAPQTLESDPQRLEQVLKNLLSNAFKFTEKGKVTLNVAPAAGGRLAFAVTDTGIGISDEHAQTIFEAFRQADGTISRKYGGTGLGLSISRELARLLGGDIALASREGEGSTFTLSLPATYDPARVAPRETPRGAPAAPAAPAPARPRPAAPPAPVRRIEDDRDALSASRRTLLVIEDDETFAAILRDLAREMGFQTLVAGAAETALALAKQHMPSAIVLDVGLPDQSGLSVLDQLKRDTATRHIPIHVVSGADHAQTALSLGAIGYALKPVKREDIADVLKKLESRLDQRMRRILVVEDDSVQREAVGKLLTSPEVETVGVGTAAECLARLKAETFDCMVLDLSLPDASGYSLLETLSREDAYSFPPVIVYTGRDLSADDEQRLRRYSKSIIIKGAKSPERLLDEVTLFLHQVVSELPDEQQRMIRKARNRDDILENRRILLVEDDVRNVYALSNILEPRGAIVEIARNGREALDRLAKGEPAIDLVLMDVMMPVMDGLTATREIRKQPEGRKLPIITLTAKAMPDDQQRCIEAGASDYMAKPLDVEKLLSLVRVWMPR